MMQAPAAAQPIPSVTMASTVSGMAGWRLRLHGPFKAASIQILCIASIISGRARSHHSLCAVPRDFASAGQPRALSPHCVSRKAGGAPMHIADIDAIAIDVPLTQNFGGSTYAVLKRSTVITRL